MFIGVVWLSGLIRHGVLFWLLFGVNKKLLTQHIWELVTKYKLLLVNNWVGQGLGLGVRARHCYLLT